MSHVTLDNVGVRFRRLVGRSHGLKEAAMRLLSRPDWYDVNQPRKDYFWGLKDLTLKLEKGDRLGIVGHNGSGKSTLLKVISRIYRPTEGRLSVDGRIAPLIEIGAGFNPELTGRENAFLNGAILGIKRKTIAARMNSILDFSELSDFIDMPVKYYSTGMYLRLAFTLATEVTPDILILDEMYAGGDQAFIERANVRLDEFVRQSSILILVAHNLEFVSRFCSRVVVLDHGRLVGDGPTDVMLDKYLRHARGDRDVFPVRETPSA